MNKKKYLDHLFEPIVIINNENEIIYYNHFFSTFTGLSPRKIKKIEDVHSLMSSVDNKIILKEQVDKVRVNGGVSVSKEGLISFVDSEDVFNCVIKVSQASEDEVLICFNDLSIEKSIYDKYRKQVEELKVSYKQLVLADKLKSIGELSAGISHEISNPLTIASGNTEILEILLESQGELSSKDDIFESISNIQSSLLRINKITLNMKKFVHEGIKSKQFVSVDRLIQSSVALVTPSFERLGITLSCEQFSDISAYVDELAIEQVLVNLLKNALDAVSYSSKKIKEVKVFTSLDSSNNSFSIFIQDSGDGIHEEDVDKIFNPFFTTKELGEGTGMGLSLSSQIIEEHQGEISLFENSKEGCTFSLTLPSAEISNYLDLETRNSNLEGTENINVLVLDEDYTNLNFYTSLNEQYGGSFLVSRSISKSIQLFESININKVIIGESLFNKENINSILSLADDIEIYVYSESDNIDGVDISGVIKTPPSKKDVFNKLELNLGDEDED
ncbi:ATP-binding protein [Halobacteriovorax sp.]|uniref:sensor histidine kinase n=1 Tax=Halobacteriovorax sp. TaxID=2020862 RepID=UPI003564A4B1